MKRAAFHLEAKLESFTRTPRGVFVRLQLSPDDVPPELAAAPAGQRYMMALSELGHFDEDKGEGDRAVQLAGILCRTESFRRFLLEKHHATSLPRDELEAAKVLRYMMKIESRSELRTNNQAAKYFQDIKQQYDIWLEKQGVL